MNGQASQRAQFGGKGLGLGGLRANVAGEMHGIAHHDARHSKPPAEPRQRAQILAAIMPPLQCQHRLRSQPQLVRHRHADAAVADIEAEVTGMENSFQLLAPGF
jgi:hypothetical protein